MRWGIKEKKQNKSVNNNAPSKDDTKTQYAKSPSTLHICLSSELRREYSQRPLGKHRSERHAICKKWDLESENPMLGAN